ncbi:gallidermin/nisin family lantibiotic [Microbispora sp. ATCC PTA-5024]|nr:gallidermin/nisin family lantibiotic [Microbispora sp. ATCC PTA-5024]ADK32554.1 microbisporicin structural preproprotein [Microbispora corallina]ETK34053.1 NAI-107 preproprotein [Microbispora sp. ATCC PTA-5024]
MPADILETRTSETEDLLDLDLSIGVEEITAGPAVTSWSLCTPGCTSPGGGSNCSFCC